MVPPAGGRGTTGDRGRREEAAALSLATGSAGNGRDGCLDEHGRAAAASRAYRRSTGTTRCHGLPVPARPCPRSFVPSFLGLSAAGSHEFFGGGEDDDKRSRTTTALSALFSSDKSLVVHGP